MEIKEKTSAKTREDFTDFKDGNPNLYSTINPSEKFDIKTFSKAAVELGGLEEILGMTKKGQITGEILENAGQMLMHDNNFFYGYDHPEYALNHVLEPTVRESSKAFQGYVMNNAESVLGVLNPENKLELLKSLDLKLINGDNEWNQFVGNLQDFKLAYNSYKSENPEDKIKYLSTRLIGGQVWAQRLLNAPGTNPNILNRLMMDYLNFSNSRLKELITNENGELKKDLIGKYSMGALETAKESKDMQYFGALANVSRYVLLKDTVSKVKENH